ncbi:uncharacterized protein BDZ99DRAFT_550843 [Mytilinidion resinicola]|uniref:Serine hydrolase domain-containing protein n=1 Tax=Mytilinidion resinicola TaxID=574789 RepID=A0A6A6Y1N1_9PEZI|nr:uncharacterized protein BDZ99DRAFT_550843 [Mytilinidion resinicola]KAF2802560.1 hypothetical protein BDZ99DRAFT_550843 [Mytilinidion resinicola]
MRILCLHGRGSNNDIFKMQTAGFRSQLDDFEFEFVQGTIGHAKEGWAIHTDTFANSGLWEYYDLLDPYNVIETEQELLQLIEDDGPYDGVLGYSQGASLAAQAIIRFAVENPTATADQFPFRFAVFINCPTPIRILEMDEKVEPDIPKPEEADANLYRMLARANPLLDSNSLFPARLGNGRRILTDNTVGLTKADAALDGQLIKIPTLHIRCPEDKEQFGLEAYELCEKSEARQFFHHHDHDFPRGYEEMRAIAKEIRSLAEAA